jgi:hypothetical protein
VQHAIKIVESLRTQDWQRSPQRTPSVLPDTFQLRLWLLPYPSFYPSSERESRLAAFASEVRDVVRRLASSGKPYHTRWPLLHQALHKCSKQEFAALALQLGALENGGDAGPTLAECLCMELTDGLLLKTEDLTEADIDAANGMLLNWGSCFDEEVRRRADERLTWLEGQIPSLPSLEQEEEKEVEGYDEDEDESDESDYDEDY